MEFRVCQVKPAEAGSPNNALQRGLPVSGWGFHPQPRRARRRNALQRGCPAPEWNSGSARRGGLAEQRASARLFRPGMEFRVCQVKPAEAGSPNSALQRGCLCQIPSPAEAGSPNNALQRGLPRPGMEFRVCPPRRARRRNALQRVWLCQAGDSIPSRGGLAEQRASARFACVRLGIPSPDSRPSPFPTAPANREASLASEVPHPRKTLLHAVWLPSQMVVGSDD